MREKEICVMGLGETHMDGEEQGVILKEWSWWDTVHNISQGE